MAKANINDEKLSLYELKQEWGFGASAARNSEEKRVLLKIKRDVVCLAKTICDDLNLKGDQNYQEIKTQVDFLAKYMCSQISFLEKALRYEVLPQMDAVKKDLLESEYGKTKYDMEADYAFWMFHEVFNEQGPCAQLEELNRIHNSALSKDTAEYHVNLLTYKTIRMNNWGQNADWKNKGLLPPVTEHSRKDLGSARTAARKQRNVCLKELYTLFDFINELSARLLVPNRVIKQLGISYIGDYVDARELQKEICKGAIAYQKQLRHSENASCWIK